MNKLIIFKLGFAQATLIQSSRGAVLVDTGIQAGTEKYERLMAGAQAKFTDIKLIIITHGHADHYGEAALLKALTGAPVLCHAKAAGYLRTGKNAPVVPCNPLGQRVAKLLRQDVLAAVRPVEPDIVIDREFDLGAYGPAGKIVLTPGHTECSLSVVLESGQAVVGDLLVANPFDGRPCMAYFAVSPQQAEDSVRRLLNCAQDFYSGHGGPFCRSGVADLIKGKQ